MLSLLFQEKKNKNKTTTYKIFFFSRILFSTERCLKLIHNPECHRGSKEHDIKYEKIINIYILMVLKDLKLVTSQIRMQTQQGCLMPSMPLTSTLMMDCGTPGACVVTMGTINYQPTPNLCGICCSIWMPISVWGPMGFIQDTQRTG